MTLDLVGEIFLVEITCLNQIYPVTPVTLGPCPFENQWKERRRTLALALVHARCEDDTERRQRPSRPDRFHWTSPFLAYGTPDQCLQFYSFVHSNLYCITLSTSFWTHLGAKHWRTLIKDSFLAADFGSICELQLAVRWVRRPCSSWQQLTHSLSHPHTIIQMSPFLTVDFDSFFFTNYSGTKSMGWNLAQADNSWPTPFPIRIPPLKCRLFSPYILEMGDFDFLHHSVVICVEPCSSLSLVNWF